MSRKNCTDIFKTHTSLLVQFLLWQAAKPSGDNCTPWRQLHPLGQLHSLGNLRPL